MSDRLKDSFFRLVRLALARTDYHALYPCRVVDQNADLTLELKPDSQKLASFSKVPIRLGVPDSSAKVSAGSRVLLGFENGDPKYPVATLWDTSTLTEFKLGRTAVDAMVKGTTYRAAEDTYLTAIVTAITTMSAHMGYMMTQTAMATHMALPAAATTGTPYTTALAALATATSTFNGASATYLSTISKVK